MRTMQTMATVTRLRRYYRLTPPGVQRLAAEVDRLNRTTSVARRRLKLLSDPA